MSRPQGVKRGNNRRLSINEKSIHPSGGIKRARKSNENLPITFSYFQHTGGVRRLLETSDLPKAMKIPWKFPENLALGF